MMMDSQNFTTQSIPQYAAEYEEEVALQSPGEGVSASVDVYLRKNATPTLLHEPSWEKLSPPMPYILLAMQDSGQLESMRRILRQQDIDVDATLQVEEALQKIRQQKYDLILLDFARTADMQNAVAKEVRTTTNPNISTPIVAITTEKDHSPGADIDEYVHAEELSARLHELLDQYVWKEFRFSKMLDRGWLAEYYDNNVEFALGAFQLFLKIPYQEIQSIGEITNKRDIQKLQAVLHKSKPSFKMVGLSTCYHEIEKLERRLKYEVVRMRKIDVLNDRSKDVQRTSIAFIRKLGTLYPVLNRRLLEFQQALQYRKQLIEHEIKRMEQYLQQ